MLNSLLTENNIRGHITRFIILLLTCFSIVYLSMLYSTASVNSRSGEMFKINQELTDLNKILIDSGINIESYLDSKNSDSFIKYLDNKFYIEDFIQRYNKGYSHDLTNLKLNNICNMLNKYIEKTDGAIEFKRARFTSRYIQSFEESQEIYILIKSEINEIKLLELNTNLDNYNNLEKSVKKLTIIFIALASLLILLSLFFIFNFTDKIIRPIENLSKHSLKVSMGRYDSISSEKTYFHEAKVLMDSMNEMTTNIKKYIDELHDKAKTEGELRTAQIKNLKIENLLKQAELTALQSQINPHFLFNCLNAGVGLAGLEDAERTSEYLGNLSQLFRYNLSGLEQLVTLRDELRNVSNYFELMKVRFSDRVKYIFQIDNKALDVTMPPLILQPLVENAFIHGFDDKEQDCIIKLTVTKIDNITYVEVYDNGQGISNEKLENLRNKFNKEDKTKENENHKGHTTGLGIVNVYQRLRLYYNIDNVMEIKSEKNKWTKIILKLSNEVDYV